MLIYPFTVTQRMATETGNSGSLNLRVNAFACITSIKPPPRTPRRTGSGRTPGGWSRRPWPGGTRPSRRSSPPAFPSLSSPTRSARTCGNKNNPLELNPNRPAPALARPSHMVCMLVLVSSKAHSTASGLSAVTRLHSISRFSLERGDEGNTVSGRSAPTQQTRLTGARRGRREGGVRTRFCRTF